MSGGIYTTQPRTKYLDRLKDVTITSPSNGQALIYQNGEWVNRAVAGSAPPSDPVFTVSESIDARNDGTYYRIATGVCANYETSPGSTQHFTYLTEGVSNSGEPDASTFGIYEKSDGGQYTTWIYTYDSNPGDWIGWCSIFGTESFLYRFAPGDFLGNVVEKAPYPSLLIHAEHYESDGFGFEGPGTPIRSGELTAGGPSGDSALQQALSAEIVNRENGDTNLQAITATNAQAISDEETARIQGDSDLQQALGTEIVDRVNIVAALQAITATNAQAISDEETARIQGDSDLQQALGTEVVDRVNGVAALQAITGTNAQAILNLEEQIDNIQKGDLTVAYTPPPPKLYDYSLYSPSQGWVSFQNRFSQYSKVTRSVFYADTPYPWGRLDDRSMNQSLFNGAGELIHGPQVYWVWEANRFQFTFGPPSQDTFQDAYSYTQFDPSQVGSDEFTLVPTSASGALQRSVHREGVYTALILENNGRSVVQGSTDGTIHPEFPIAVTLTLDPHLLTSHSNFAVYQDDLWVEKWGMFATYSPHAEHLLLSRDGMVWDRIATGLNIPTSTMMHVYPYGDGLGFLIQVNANKPVLAVVQQTPYTISTGEARELVLAWSSQGGDSQVLTAVSTGEIVMVRISNNDKLYFSQDGLSFKTAGVSAVAAGPFLRSLTDPYTGNVSKQIFSMNTNGIINVSNFSQPGWGEQLLTMPVNPTWSTLTTPGVPDSFPTQLTYANHPAQDGSGYFLAASPTWVRRYGDTDDSNVIMKRRDGTDLNNLTTTPILGEIGAALNTRTYSPIFACSSVVSAQLVSFDRGVSWKPTAPPFKLAYSFAHNEHVFVCVGFPINRAGDNPSPVIAYSVDAVNWSIAVTDASIGFKNGGDALSQHRFSDVYYEAEYRRFVAFSQNRVGLSGDGVHWTFVPIPADQGSSGTPPAFAPHARGWNEYLRYGDGYYTRGDEGLLMKLTIAADGTLNFTNTPHVSKREQSRTATLNYAENGQYSYPQWWSTSLGIYAAEWREDGAGFDIYNYRFARDQTQGDLTKTLVIGDHPTWRFKNYSTGFGGLIANYDDLDGDDSQLSVLRASVDGLVWRDTHPFGTTGELATQIAYVTYTGGDQYLARMKDATFRVGKGNINACMELGTTWNNYGFLSGNPIIRTTEVGDSLLFSRSGPTMLFDQGRGRLNHLIIFTTNTTSYGVKPIAVVPRVSEDDTIGGGRPEAGDVTPGIDFPTGTGSYQVSRRVGLGDLSSNNIPTGSSVEFELTPNLPLNFTITSSATWPSATTDLAAFENALAEA